MYVAPEIQHVKGKTVIGKTAFLSADSSPRACAPAAAPAAARFVAQLSASGPPAQHTHGSRFYC